MAQFNPGKLTNEEVQGRKDGMMLNLMLPPKVFSSGKEGFFRQAMYTDANGTKYRLNLQVYEMKKD